MATPDLIYVNGDEDRLDEYSHSSSEAPSYNGKGIRPLPHADSKIDLDNDHPYNTMYLKPLSTMDEQDEEQVNDDFALTLRDPDQEPPNLMEGVIFEYVKGTFDYLPDFDSLESTNTGIMSSISIDDTTEPTILDAESDYDTQDLGDFAVRFRCHLKIPIEGEWTFFLGSNDGSALFIDGKQIINNDGTHYFLMAQGSLTLTEGVHVMTVSYFHRNGKVLEGLRAGPKLTLEYQCATPSMFWPFKSDAVKRQPIAVDNLFYDRRELQAFEQGVNPTELEAQKRIEELEKALIDLRISSDAKITSLELQLMEHRAQLQNIAEILCDLRLSEGNEADTLSSGDQQVVGLLERHVHDVDYLKESYFFALGLAMKLSKSSQLSTSSISIQDTFEHCIKERIPVQEWKSELASKLL